MIEKPKTILITGASGYIGGRLLEALLPSEYSLRALMRETSDLSGVEVVKGDILDKDSLKKALKGVDVAFYLIHSMGKTGDFVDLDRQGAANFGQAASEMGVKKIIYLGGLGNSSKELSSHLKSRHEVGQILKNTSSGVQVIEFRASIIIGAGSLSFEMIKALVDKLPIMITPKWVWTLAQPIAISDVLEYLKQAIEIQVDGNQIYEIGGADKVSYGDIMIEYGRQVGLHRKMINVPVLTPRLSSLWLGLVTPLYAKVGRKLVDSALCETIVHDPLARHVFKIKPVGLKESIEKAIQEMALRKGRWIDSETYMATPPKTMATTGQVFDMRELSVSANAEEAFKPIMSIGGDTGWYYGNILWRLRGLLDLLIGGAGFRRGRRDPHLLRVGDVIDFWRVQEIIPHKKLLLYAEMKVPGEAWLEFNVEEKDGKSLITQRATFIPSGLFGKLYWYMLFPIHIFIFRGMINGISRQIKQEKS